MAAIRQTLAPADQIVYEDSDTLWHKALQVAQKICGAAAISADTKVRTQLQRLPVKPSSADIDVDDEGRIVGLF